MRTKQAVAAAVALLALVATASCDDGAGPSGSQSGQAAAGKNGGQAGGGSDGDGTAGSVGRVEAGLAKVAGTDELVRLISNATTCTSASTKPKDTTFSDIDDASSGGAVADIAKTNTAAVFGLMGGQFLVVCGRVVCSGWCGPGVVV
ncbi:hypothetical protein ACFVWA_29925, partial [Streptomyces goshikiensis]